MDGKLIFSAGSYGLFFAIAFSIVGIGAYLVLSAAISAFRARNNAERVPTGVYIGSILGLVLILLPIYPLALLRSTNDMLVDSEPEMYEFVANMVRITNRGFNLYKETLPTATPDMSTPTPAYTMDGTPFYATDTPPAPVETAVPTATPEQVTKAPPTVTGVWSTLEPEETATAPVLNPDEGPPTATIDPIVARATENAARVTAVPTLNPDTWNPQTPAATPVR